MSLEELSMRPTSTYTKNMSHQGPVVRIAPNQFSLDDPNAIKAIYGIGKPFAKSHWYKASSDPKAPFPDLFTDRNPARHSANRRLVANLYSATSLRAMEGSVDDCIDLFLARMSELARSGESFDMQFWMQCYAFDVIGQITVGQRVGFLDKGTDDENIFASLHDYLKYCAVIGVLNEAHGPLSWLMSLLPENGIAHVAKFTHHRIQEGQRRRASHGGSEKSQDFLSKSLDLHEANPEKFPEAAIQTLCLTNFGAGSDTTSISLCAILFNLISHPHALSKLRGEINEKLAELGNAHRIPFKETQSMPFLQACIKEGLRLHPATGLPLARVVPEGGATISGQFFPAGSVVGVNSWVAHRNTNIFGLDACEFRPERWLIQDKEKLSLMDSYWIPFGVGSRTCIGKNISLLEINKLIPVLIKNFDFSKAAECNVTMENYWLVKQKGMIDWSFDA
ncbi:cytochrome P450 [Dactylonectria macrodidyma]|uniref:Cytochrome P450 n=1 Tax=Dactylonectria macrodidyma TaxID=307937 RepID=A0A9P9EAZ6_9HYPO|nr:cytochrome P450 [Dactylonectria macrodidyma]